MIDNEYRRSSGKIEFDVLIDGKYHKRVSRGLLVAMDNDPEIEFYMKPDINAIFMTAYAMLKLIRDSGSEKDFEEFLEYHFREESGDNSNES